MAQTISRKASGVRRQSRARGARRKNAPRGRRGEGLSARIARIVPLTERQLHAFLTALILLAAVLLAGFVAVYAGALDVARGRVAAMASDAGFQVRRVEVRGVERMNELAVYERALAERDRAMTLVDLERLRRSLLELPYVEDARVSRQLPDGLIVDIVEREPHAVMRQTLDDGSTRLMLVDIGGHLLEPVSRTEARRMLVVSGEGVEQHLGDLERLLDAAPPLREQVAEAEWVGNRRWNLTFRTDQNLALPQGENLAAGALVRFAQENETYRLLGGQVASFDMRTPERIYLRVPGRAEAQAAMEEGT